MIPGGDQSMSLLMYGLIRHSRNVCSNLVVTSTVRSKNIAIAY